MPHGQVYDKVMANIQEIKARGGPVIAVVSEGDREVGRLADHVIEVPAVEEFLQPIVTRDSAATAGLLHRRRPRLRRRQAAEPGQERDGGSNSLRGFSGKVIASAAELCFPHAGILARRRFSGLRGTQSLAKAKPTGAGRHWKRNLPALTRLDLRDPAAGRMDDHRCAVRRQWPDVDRGCRAFLRYLDDHLQRAEGSGNAVELRNHARA